ncbi:bacteriocin immunity protein [Secundilactobacillus kimchicus]|uniref:bacteriocin immunity protein n=1 Tax=Secundilactobacillus kimchicus TaxID=528209 RepID=UPI0024A88309|nr:bacteriocin immunity protein [Secundilactobacillus kimchicus]
MKRNNAVIEKAKPYIKALCTGLKQYSEQPKELRDITDVLTQVYKKIDSTKNPEALVNRLVNYIYVAGFGAIHLKPEDEKLLIELGAIGSKAGWNGRYMSDFANKSQFYSIFDK